MLFKVNQTTCIIHEIMRKISTQNLLYQKLASFNLQVSHMDLELSCDGIFVLDFKLLYNVSNNLNKMIYDILYKLRNNQ